MPLSIQKIKEAIEAGKLSWADIETHCRKVLMAKYEYGLAELKPINTDNIVADLNKEVNSMRKLIAENALTVLRKTDDRFFPLQPTASKEKTDVVYVGIGAKSKNAFAARMRSDHNADVIFIDYTVDAATVTSTVARVKKKYKNVVIGVHGFGRAPANNFGLSNNAISLVSQLQQ